MGENSIQVEYNTELSPLVELLSKVKRPGDFYVAGSLEAPMPRLDIEGVGTVSFPVPKEQAKQIIRHAEQAPYGRGEETIVDTKVRKVWQVPPAKVQLGGTTWPKTFATILSRVVEGLGCQKASVSAELYKLLVYDEGGFFVAHRDTEKAEGMFGTLVVVLPSFHSGGELIVRHAGREVTLDLRPREVSQLSYAAFYADCEHEVRPITGGNRVCLVYNLIQKPRGKGRPKPLSAPVYEKETGAATKLLQEWGQCADTPPKIVYLLEHEYSPAGLSFASLKNADAAFGKVLSQAAQQAGFAVHLGIVHIEETGSAELTYDPYYGRSRRYGRYYEEAEEEEEGEEQEDYDEDFEIVEAFDTNAYISDWVGLNDRAAEYGQVPLGEGELLPEDALEEEPPDKQRVSEATGNEGATYERSYHRAALVLWRQDRYPEVLLQGGVGAVLPYFREQVEAWSRSAKSASRPPSKKEIVSLTKRIIDAWQPDAPVYETFDRPRSQPPDRAAMLKLLRTLKEPELLQRFIENVVVPQYDGSENAQLVASSALLEPDQVGEWFAILMDKNLPLFPRACVELLGHLIDQQKRRPELLAATRHIATTAVQALAKVKVRDPMVPYHYADWVRAKKAKPVDAGMVVNLIEALRRLQDEQLLDTAAATLVEHSKVFLPDTILLPALSRLHQEHGERIGAEPAFSKLWQHAAEFLLARSESPPPEPTDWAQPVKISCHCGDCRQLQEFAEDPQQHVHRFAVAKDRRQHLHQTIERHNLDMTHVTERIGRPQTLVCTKTRRTYENRCQQYAQDIKSFRALAALAAKLPKDLLGLEHRIQEAIARV